MNNSNLRFSGIIALPIIGLLTFAAGAQALPDEVTIDGRISLGRIGGLIFDERQSYIYDRSTKNLAALAKACPTEMLEEVPCKVRFKTDGKHALEIVAAAAPRPHMIPVNRPGSIYDAWLCDQESQVSYEGNPGCRHFDNLDVQVLSMDQDTTQVRWNGSIKYALSARVDVNCQGIPVSLASFISKSFPPGMKQC